MGHDQFLLQGESYSTLGASTALFRLNRSFYFVFSLICMIYNKNVLNYEMKIFALKRSIISFNFYNSVEGLRLPMVLLFY